VGRVASLAFLNFESDFQNLASVTHMGFFGNQKNPDHIWLLFQSQRLGSGRTLSELHIYYKYLVTRVYDHAGCKEYCKYFTVALT